MFLLTIVWALLLSPYPAYASLNQDMVVKKKVWQNWSDITYRISTPTIALDLSIDRPKTKSPYASLYIFNCKAANCTQLINKAISLLLKEAKPFIVKSSKLEVYLTPHEIPDIFSHYIQAQYEKEKKKKHNTQGCKFKQGKYEYSDHTNAWKFIEEKNILMPLFKGLKGFNFDTPLIPVDRHETNAFAKIFCVATYKKLNPYYKIPSFIPSWYLVNNAGTMDITFNK